MTSEVRDLTPREERRFGRQAARRYAHGAMYYRRCGTGFCLPCLWRSLTGVHRRRKAALVERGRAHREQVRACAHEWTLSERGDRPHSVCYRCNLARWRAP